MKYEMLPMSHLDILKFMFNRGLQHISTSTAAPIPHNFRNVPQPVIHHFDPSVPPPAFRGAQPAMFAPSGSTWRGNIPAPR